MGDEPTPFDDVKRDGPYIVSKPPKDEIVLVGIALFRNSTCDGVHLHGVVTTDPDDDGLGEIPGRMDKAEFESDLKEFINDGDGRNHPEPHPSGSWEFIARCLEPMRSKDRSEYELQEFDWTIEYRNTMPTSKPGSTLPRIGQPRMVGGVPGAGSPFSDPFFGNPDEEESIETDLFDG